MKMTLAALHRRSGRGTRLMHDRDDMGQDVSKLEEAVSVLNDFLEGDSEVNVPRNVREALAEIEKQWKETGKRAARPREVAAYGGRH